MEDTNWKIVLDAVPARDRSPATDAAIDNGSDIVVAVVYKNGRDSRKAAGQP
jgi:hypothetical protein